MNSAECVISQMLQPLRLTGRLRSAKAASVEPDRDVELAEQAGDVTVEVRYAGERAGAGGGHEALDHEAAPLRHGDAQEALEDEQGKREADREQGDATERRWVPRPEPSARGVGMPDRYPAGAGGGSPDGRRTKMR